MKIYSGENCVPLVIRDYDTDKCHKCPRNCGSHLLELVLYRSMTHLCYHWKIIYVIYRHKFDIYSGNYDITTIATIYFVIMFE